MGSLLASRLHAEPVDVLRMFMPLMLFAASALVLAGVFSDNIVWYMSSISFLQFVVFPPIIAYHTEFTGELPELAGTAMSVDLFCQYMLSSVVTTLSLGVVQGSTRSVLFTLAATVVVTQLITGSGIGPLASDAIDADKTCPESAPETTCERK